MKNYTLFLRWWLLVCSICVGVYYCHQFHLLAYMWEKDVTKLSVVILSLFAISTFISGVNSFKVSKYLFRLQKNDNAEKFSYDIEYTYENKIKKLKKKLSLSWFLSGVFTGLGLLGTVIGMLIALSGFGTVNISDIAQSKILIASMALGVSTALISTLVGLTCSLLLKIQCFNIDYCLGQIKETHDGR